MQRKYAREYPEEAAQKGALYKHFRVWLSATYHQCFNQEAGKSVLDENARAMESPLSSTGSSQLSINSRWARTVTV